MTLGTGTSTNGGVCRSIAMPTGGAGGAITILVGDGTLGTGGAMTLTAGKTTAASAVGGAMSLTAGEGAGTGGDVTITDRVPQLLVV